MRYLRFIFILCFTFSAFFGLISTELISFGEARQGGQDIYHPDIEHIEIVLPTRLLDGFELINESLTMEESVKIGLQKNLSIEIAGDERNYHHALWKRAKSKRWPVLTAGSFSYLRSDNSGFLRTPGMITRTVSDDNFSQEFSLYAKVPIFTGGLIRSGIRINRYNLEGAEANLDDVFRKVSFDIRKTYLEALLTKAEHHIHQKHKEVQEELLRQARSKYKNGKGLKADVLRIHSEVAGAQAKLNEQHNRLNQGLFELKILMGVDLGSQIILLDQLKLKIWGGESLAILVKETLKTHPKVLEAQTKVLSAKANMKAVRSEYFPQVYGQVSGNIRLPENKPELGTGVVGLFTASWSLLNRERDYHFKATKIKYLKTQKEARYVEIQLAKEIAQTWSEMIFSEANVKLAKIAVDEAQEELRLMQRRFEVGRALNVEVQDGVLTLLQAQLSHARTLFNHELAKAKLKRVAYE